MSEVSKRTIPIGKTPSILLINPKYGKNVGMVVRLASCYGVSQVWHTGNRLSYDLKGFYARKSKPNKHRLPREERMKCYQDVQLINFDYPFEQFAKNVTPVAIEVRENAQMLHEFEHPENPLYVFGPEDGSIDPVWLRHCHRFVVIPTRHCLNLATAVSTILWDRQYKEYLNGRPVRLTPGEFERRGVHYDFTMWL
jgi:tRNA(Leu) C34 or U34 (ribose-2'-O)-methylase TrmL